MQALDQAKVQTDAKEALLTFQQRPGFCLEFSGEESVDDNSTPICFRAGAAVSVLKQLGWEIVSGDTAGYADCESSHYVEARKELADDEKLYVTIRIADHEKTSLGHERPTINIAGREDCVCYIAEILEEKSEEFLAELQS